mgnify:CR=1 FL=1
MSIKIFDMSCTHGHRFEAWFSSLEDCDGQLARGLVVCPYCETSDVKRMPTAAHIGADVSASEDADRTVSAQESVVREAAERFFAGVRKTAESAVDVGEDFPRQARAMYRGAMPQRLIKGMCTRKEARELVEEGIGVGLYLAREIISMQEGYIEVVSEAGAGAEIRIFLPNG